MLNIASQGQVFRRAHTKKKLPETCIKVARHQGMKRAREIAHERRRDGREYVSELACFLREPNVRHCMNSIQNDCLTNDIVFTENGHAVSPKFHRHIQFRYKVFARGCIEYLHTCQFIPWYIERVHGEAVPRTLPFGSFTWQAQFKTDAELTRGAWPIKYVLRGIDFDIAKLDVQIFYAVNPLYREMFSPLDTLQAYYTQADVARTEVASCMKSSMHTVVLVSETVDVKMQTESGIDLLDASRRYNVGGKTGNEYAQTQVLTSAESGAVLNSVNEAQMCWISNVQRKHENLGMSLMPPNSQVTQIAAPTVQSDVMTQLQEHYRASVHTHFNVKQHGGAHGSAGASREAPGSLTEQYNSVLHVAQFLEDFLPHVYRVNFNTTDAVLCSLLPANKLEVSSIADVKVLSECNIFSTAEIRKMVAFAPSRAHHS